jgi:hypothetical protein
MPLPQHTVTHIALEKLHVLNTPFVGKFLHCLLAGKPGKTLLFKSIGSVIKRDMLISQNLELGIYFKRKRTVHNIVNKEESKAVT